jgi:hypothetical protein
MELGFGSLGQKNGASQEILKDYRTYTCNACNAALHYRHFRQKMTLNTVYKTTISLLWAVGGAGNGLLQGNCGLVYSVMTT